MALLNTQDLALVRRAFTLMTMRGADALTGHESPLVAMELSRALAKIRAAGLFPQDADIEEAVRKYCESAVIRQL